MANIGLSQPYYAKYTHANGAVTYSALKKLGKAVDVDITIDNKEPQVLYADNGPAESVTLFGGGTATLGTDELSLDVAADILGMTAPTTDAPGVTFLADANAPYVGLGFIVMKVFENLIKWRMVVLYKTKFMIPDYAITTKGETVEFQTPSLAAQILRDDSVPSKWQYWNDYNTEADALAALQTALGGTQSAQGGNQSAQGGNP